MERTLGPVCNGIISCTGIFVAGLYRRVAIVRALFEPGPFVMHLREQFLVLQLFIAKAYR
jgi:hypothetical protein